MKKVLIIAYYFPPLGWSGVQRTLKFVKYLRDFEWEPIVVTVGETKFSILDNTLLDEIPNGVEVIRIDDVKFKTITDKVKRELKENVLSSFDIIADKKLKQEYEEEIEKIFNDLRNLFLLPDGNAIWANKIIKEISEKVDLDKIDIVYTTSSPYSSHIVGYYLKKTFKLPWICDFRDEWTNNPYLGLDRNTLRYKIEKDIENSIISYSDKIIMPTLLAEQNYREMYKLEKSKIDTITNGYDEDDFKNINLNLSRGEKFKIVYNGSFYSEINPYTFVEAVLKLISNKLINEKKIEIIFNGKNDEQIVENVRAMIYTNSQLIKFNGYLSHKESLRSASQADLLLLVLGKEEKTKAVYTGKVFEYLRLQKPIISISPRGSLVEKLLQETNCGTNVEYDDVENIQKIILGFYNNWINDDIITFDKRRIKKYDRKKQTRRLSRFLNEVLTKQLND